MIGPIDYEGIDIEYLIPVQFQFALISLPILKPACLAQTCGVHAPAGKGEEGLNDVSRVCRRISPALICRFHHLKVWSCGRRFRTLHPGQNASLCSEYGATGIACRLRWLWSIEPTVLTTVILKDHLTRWPFSTTSYNYGSPNRRVPS